MALDDAAPRVGGEAERFELVRVAGEQALEERCASDDARGIAGDDAVGREAAAQDRSGRDGIPLPARTHEQLAAAAASVGVAAPR